ncbi:molybdopterin-dependent oxidoreductase [Nocardioides cavernaquae]|uniref:Molybdopterin oxidoreductase family protein n=1 Tax=Nocardioides cavernaquae TaxID=2321396 RepID=A0A3A5H4T6_9ACTN|nr:molybdopterin-dependent oxidoreductase [Nocardioides cavernaquae]RJS44888.1 molybdopterin oxidoreductase family protein [Nocardioides cavernaquae]
MEKQLGVCNLCEAICGLELTIDEGRVTGVRGNPDDPLSRGHICPKGVAIADIYEDPDRLRHPVRRVGAGVDARWEEISWDEAFDLVASGLSKAMNKDPDSLAIYLGNPNVHSLGAMTHGVTLAGSFRTKNKYSATSVDQLPHQLMSYLLYGHQLLIPIPDIDRTDYFLVFGANPMASNGSLMTVPDFPGRRRELRDRGGRMVVLDPRRTETAKVADEHVFVRPGTDAWVLLALLHTLIDSGLTNPPEWVDGLDTVAEAVKEFTPEHAEAMSGVPAATIRRIATEFATAPRAAAYGRMGVSVNEFGTVCQWALQLINLLTGNLDREGGVMLPSPAIDVVKLGLLGRGHIARYTSRVRGLAEFGGELPVSVLREEIETPGMGQVRALFTIAGNPVLSTPDGGALERALTDLDFYAAVDIYVNETTRHADVILPPTSALERDHYDLVFHHFAVRNTARFTPAVFAKGRDQRHDWQIFKAIGLRTIRRLDHKPSLKRRIMLEARLRPSPTFLIANLLRFGRSRALMSDLRKSPAGVDLGPLQSGQLPGRLLTRNKRVDAAPSFVLDDLARLRDQPAPTEGELLLIGRRHQKDCNSWMHNSERLTKGRDRHQLLVNPADLAARGLVSGDTVTVTSRVGEVKVEALATDDMMPGVVSLPHGYGHQRDGVLLGRATQVAGVSINDLTDSVRVDISGNAAFSGLPVTIA